MIFQCLISSSITRRCLVKRKIFLSLYFSHSPLSLSLHRFQSKVNGFKNKTITPNHEIVSLEIFARLHSYTHATHRKCITLCSLTNSNFASKKERVRIKRTHRVQINICIFLSFFFKGSIWRKRKIFLKIGVARLVYHYPKVKCLDFLCYHVTLITIIALY